MVLQGISVDLPGTLYYSAGNIHESSVDEVEERNFRGNVPFASGLVHLFQSFRTCDSASTRSIRVISGSCK